MTRLSLFAAVLMLAGLVSAPAMAQEELGSADSPPASLEISPVREPVPANDAEEPQKPIGGLGPYGLLKPMPAEELSADLLKFRDYGSVRLRTLDKMTGRTQTFDARVGTTIRFGALYIRIQACREPPPMETPESAAFLQVWEVTPEDKAEWVFSGWMFASSPALSSMDHAVYDVWVLDCPGKPSGDAPEDEGAEGEITLPDLDALPDTHAPDPAPTVPEDQTPAETTPAPSVPE